MRVSEGESDKVGSVGPDMEVTSVTLADYIRLNDRAADDMAPDARTIKPLDAEPDIGPEPEETSLIGVILVAKIVVGLIVALVLVRTDVRLVLPMLLVVAIMMSYVGWIEEDANDE